MPRTTGVYLPLLATEWGLALYVARIGRPRSALRALLGAGWHSFKRAFTDLALAALLFVQVQCLELLLRADVASANLAREALLPALPAEYALWGLVAVSAGFCEELIYRGYLFVQLRAFTGSVVIACLAQATLFGLAHAEQGANVALRFGVYGLMFGALALFRRSLIPGIVAHVALDFIAALR